VKIAMMQPAQRYDEFVAHPAAECARLPESEMVGI
jgi:hypothetical protein